MDPRPDAVVRGRFAVHSPTEALDAFAALASLDRSQVLVLLLDADHRGATCLAVDDVPAPDGVLRVGSLVADLARHDIGLAAVALASVRPGAGPELADIERWNALSARLASAGVTLLEWFVLGEHAAAGIGELVGGPWRWRSPDPSGWPPAASGRAPPSPSP